MRRNVAIFIDINTIISHNNTTFAFQDWDASVWGKGRGLNGGSLREWSSSRDSPRRSLNDT